MNSTETPTIQDAGLAAAVAAFHEKLAAQGIGWPQPEEWLEEVRAAVEADRAVRSIDPAKIETLSDVVSAGIAYEVGKFDARNHYTDEEMARVNARWDGARSVVTRLKEMYS